MNGPELQFDWDAANAGHLARHNVLPDEAEQVIACDPLTSGWKSSKGRSATFIWERPCEAVLSLS